MDSPIKYYFQMAKAKSEFVSSNERTLEKLYYIFLKIIPQMLNDKEINSSIIDINKKFEVIEKDAQTMSISDQDYLKPLMDPINQVISNNCEERSKLLTLEEFYIVVS